MTHPTASAAAATSESDSLHGALHAVLAKVGGKTCLYKLACDRDSLSVEVPMAVVGNASLPTMGRLARAFTALPNEVRGALRSMVLTASPAPQHAAWKKGTTVWLQANKATGTITVFPNAARAGNQYALSQALCYAAGQCLEATFSTQQRAAWQEAIAHDAILPAEFGFVDGPVPAPKSAPAPGRRISDDVAETVVLYQQVAGTAAEQKLRHLMPRRFAILESLATRAAP